MKTVRRYYRQLGVAGIFFFSSVAAVFVRRRGPDNRQSNSHRSGYFS